jgi:hypothetical protein
VQRVVVLERARCTPSQRHRGKDPHKSRRPEMEDVRETRCVPAKGPPGYEANEDDTKANQERFSHTPFLAE